MKNRRTHNVGGAVVGGGAALVKSAGQPAGCLALKTAGGVLAVIGLGMLPDVIEPAVHPDHRSLIHEEAPAVVLGSLATQYFDSRQASLRALVEQQVSLEMQSHSQLTQLWHAFLELLFRLLAGAVAGRLGGYGSYLALDAFTPRILPLIA